jgi:hypothetical protein
MNYPKREPFFAHKFVRLLTKSCAAQDIGLNAFALLCVIAHQEDSARYCGPVRFWNEQLMSTLSLSPRALRDARDKSIKFGWLVYFRENDRATGRYFVTVPKQFAALSDSPIEEPCAVRGEVSSEVSGADSHMKVHKEVTSNRTRSEHESAPEPSPPSIPVPDPVPNPPPEQSIFGEMAIPPNLNEDELSEIARWAIAMRDEPTFFPGSPSLQEKVRRAGLLKKDGHSIADLVSLAIAGSYKMLYPERESSGKKRGGASRYSNDLMATLKVCKSHPGRDAWQEREKYLTAEQIQALKRAGGSTALLEAAGNDWNLQTFSEIYEAHLKDIRSGIKTSN